MTRSEKSQTDLDFESLHVAQVVFYTDIVGQAIVAEAGVAQLIAVVVAEPEAIDLDRFTCSHLRGVWLW